MRTSRVILGALMAGIGLAVYLWPAWRAPVVVNSDSAIDLAWARAGAGIITPAFAPNHPAKPGYLLFLRAVGAGGSNADLRRLVVVQSILLWLSIAACSIFAARRIGWGRAAVLYAALVLFLRLRDSTSFVMSEALSAALLLPFAAFLLMDRSRRLGVQLGVGLSAAVLFLVRPNVGAIALLLALAGVIVERRGLDGAGALVGGFAILVVPVALATTPPEDPFRGLAFARRMASADYGWISDAGPPGAASDRVRAEVWRALHGLLGMETYDARWSAIYGELTTASRLITPFAILGAAAVLMAAPTSGRSRLPKALGLLLLAALVTESILVGALPRYALPFLPALFLFAFGCASELLASSAGRRAAAVAIALALVFAIRWQRQTLDWEWGLIDASGVRLRLVVPRGRLPEPGETPATLHVRIGASVHPAAVAVTIRDERGEILPAQGPPAGPFVSVSLTDAVRRANRERDVALTLVSSGSFDSTHFLIFPAIPPPWAAATLREGSPALSGETGIAAGSLDWWAHAGAP